VTRARLEEPLSIDVSALLGFVVRHPAHGQPLPVELGEGESVRLQVAVWSSFPQPLALDSLLLSLVAPPSRPRGGRPREAFPLSPTFSLCPDFPPASLAPPLPWLSCPGGPLWCMCTCSLGLPLDSSSVPTR